MNRIAAALLIAAAVLALNGGMLREAFAGEAARPTLQSMPPVTARGAKVLSLLLILEALRQTPISLDAQKV